MAMPQTQAREVQVQGEFTTAEVTHVLEALKLEGQCYIKNHAMMKLCGEQAGIREWHDNVTRANLERFKPFAQQMGIPLPFAKPLEERENELKAKMQGANVEGAITEAEALEEVKTTGKMLAEFYTVSLGLATHDRVRDAFRRGFEAAADNLPKVEQRLQNTPAYFPPPTAEKVRVTGAPGRGAR